MPVSERAQPDLTAANPAELHALAAAGRQLPSLFRLHATVAGGTELSRYRGRGVEYDESRHYQQGDDIRHLDARVTARRGEPFTKIYREDRERPVFLCVDDRACMHFATRGRFKRVIASKAAALLAWKAFYEGNRVVALIFRDEEQERLSAYRGRAALARLLQALSTPARWRSVNDDQLAVSLHAGLALLPRDVPSGALLIVLSDFRGLDEPGQVQLLGLRRRCELVFGQIYDPLERALPRAPGRYPVANALGEAVIFGGDGDAQARFAADVARRDARLESLARALRARVAPLATDCDPAIEIHRLLRAHP